MNRREWYERVRDRENFIYEREGRVRVKQLRGQAGILGGETLCNLSLESLQRYWEILK